MTINNKSKAAMEAVKSLPELPALQGARRATGDAGNSAPPAGPTGTDAEVVPRARRRTFTNADKRRILQAADRCSKPGEIGALMRREGVYSSSLSTWRRQREALQTEAFYVGAIGSRRNNDARRERLIEHFHVSAGSLARLRGPIGIYVGSKTPPEIAVSIMAEILAVKNGVTIPYDMNVAQAKEQLFSAVEDPPALLCDVESRGVNDIRRAA